MNVQPLISIAIPTLNRPKYLAECIEACCKQNYYRIEIIISDNCSDDNTNEFVRSMSLNDPRIKYFKLTRRVSFIDNYNNCIKHASGEFITFVCDDDIILENYISDLLKMITADNNVELARGVYSFVDESLNIIEDVRDRFDFPKEEKPIDFILESLKGKRTLPTTGFICRTCVLREIGGFIHSGFPRGVYSEHPTWFRIALKGDKVISSDNILWLYRIHSSNLISEPYSKVKHIKNIPNYLSIIDQLPTEQISKVDLENAKKAFIANNIGGGLKGIIFSMYFISLYRFRAIRMGNSKCH